MSEKPLPFVVTDRRKFRADGEPRPDADPAPPREARPETIAATPPSAKIADLPPAAPPPPPPPPAAADMGSSFAAGGGSAFQPEDPAPDADPDMPPAPTAEQMEQSRLAFNATAERLDIAIRSANPGAEHPPAMSFEQLVQSVYMQAILQLGGGTREGEKPQVDLLGARQSIDMLDILDAKTHGNLNPGEANLLSSAIFELRLAFLDVTQALARSAQQRQQAHPGAPPPPGGRPGPSIVR